MKREYHLNCMHETFMVTSSLELNPEIGVVWCQEQGDAYRFNKQDVKEIQEDYRIGGTRLEKIKAPSH